MEAAYYSIDEAAAGAARSMWSMSAYRQGSETEGYREKVDAAYRLADEAAGRDPGVFRQVKL